MKTHTFYFAGKSREDIETIVNSIDASLFGDMFYEISDWVEDPSGAYVHKIDTEKLINGLYGKWNSCHNQGFN